MKITPPFSNNSDLTIEKLQFFKEKNDAMIEAIEKVKTTQGATVSVYNDDSQRRSRLFYSMERPAHC